MRQPRQASLVYASCVPIDQALLDRLLSHLNPLVQAGWMEIWFDHLILPGAETLQEKRSALARATLFLVLLSADYLSSEEHLEEMRQALFRQERGETRVIPILLRPCLWQETPIGHLGALPRNGQAVTTSHNPEEALAEIAWELRQMLASPSASLPQRSSLDQLNRTHLLKRVQTLWIEGLLERSLHEAARLDLPLQEQPDALANPWCLQVQELHQAPHLLAAHTSIAQVYDDANGKLLILGEPGAGKTTLLLDLARTLLRRAEHDSAHPMPVIFNLSSWAQKQPSLSDWLVEELHSKYQVPYTVGEIWIEARQILPLLDGLDEVAQNARNACVQAISVYHQGQSEHLGTPLVICCRSQEYATLPARFSLRRAVSILPFSLEAVERYLQQAGKHLSTLRDAIKRDEELAKLACRPLLLSIFTLAYQDTEAVNILGESTQEERLHALFATYVERMLSRRGQIRIGTKEQFLQRLAYLAKHMQKRAQTVFLVETLQLDWFPDKGEEKAKGCWRWSERTCARLFGAIFFGLTLVPITTLAVGLFLGPLGGSLGGLLFALFLGLGNRLFGWFEDEIQPAERLTWSGEFSLRGTVGFFGLWLLLGLTIEVTNRFANWLIILPITVLAGLATTVLLDGLAPRKLMEGAAFSPNGGIWQSGKNGLSCALFGTLLGGAVGLVFGWVLLGTFGQPIGMVLGGLDIAVIGALFGGVNLGGGAVIRHFLLRFWLWRWGYLPWNLIPFLDEAAERLLLRKVGGSYLFAHRLLLDYFASLDVSAFSRRDASEKKAKKHPAI